jgi:GNAT superfamily N-acetyltransferase
MTIKNMLTLTIRTTDFNVVAQQPELLAQLRKLTLDAFSGLNHEMDRMLEDVKTRPVKCQVLLAYRFSTLVGWAILSKETTNYRFMRSDTGFNSENGMMFQVYVDPAYRRQGIATEIYKKAQQLAKDELLHVCPWDNRSTEFYTKFENVNTKWL